MSSYCQSSRFVLFLVSGTCRSLDILELERLADTCSDCYLTFVTLGRSLCDCFNHGYIFNGHRFRANIRYVLLTQCT